MKNVFLFVMLALSTAAQAAPPSPCDSQAEKNPCDAKACGLAKEAFRETTHLDGEVTNLYSQWGFLSDIPIYTISVEVSARNGSPIKQAYSGRLEANDQCFIWSFGKSVPGEP